jgi:LuxR family transcriptional regulator, maltose regulon positive regulatory protein
VPANFVARDELRARLARGSADFPVMLVCAPAGYGKTLLLADWVEHMGGVDKAWVSLDAADNAAGRFWHAVLHAVCGCPAVPPTSRLYTLQPPGGPATTDFVADVIDGLAALPRRLHLVLDDLQEVLDTETWHGIAMLVRHQPQNLRLVLSTRADPMLPLARLRLQHELGELRADDLRFTTDEAAQLLDRADAGLDADQVRRLTDQTAGWPAGLRLAARSMWDAADREAFLTQFTGNDRAIADFLVSEVLARLPAATADVLALVSVCDEVTPALAVALSGRADAGTILAGLERDSSLVLGVGVARQWFRTHPLLRSYLLADLERQRPGVVAELHDKATLWFAEQEWPAKAFDHVTQTGDSRRIVDLLRGSATTVLLTGDDDGSVRRALDAVGENAVGRDPWLATVSALAHVLAGEHGEADADLAACWAAWPGEPEPELLRLRELVLATQALIRCRRAPATAVRWGELVAAYEAGEEEAWARLAHGWALLCAGDTAEARFELETAARLARVQGLDHVTVLSLSVLAVLSCQYGAFPAMGSACAAVLELAYAHGWATSPWLSATHLMTGLERLLCLDPDAALEEAAHAAAALPTDAEALRYLVDLLTGAALVDVGRRQEGLALLQRARHDKGQADVPAPLLLTGALIEHRCTLALGHDVLAQHLMAWTRERIGSCAELALMHAWTSFTRDGLRATELAVREALDDERPALCPTTRLEARLLETALEIRLGRRTRALGALNEALALAEPASLIRPFHHADDSVRQLLLEQVGGFGRTNAFAAKVSQTVSTMDTAMRDVLTTREHAVLVRLSSPQSLDELATDMSVSVNTVKTHVRAIYAKLGVNNRRAAVVAGRQLGLR